MYPWNCLFRSVTKDLIRFNAQDYVTSFLSVTRLKGLTIEGSSRFMYT